MSTSLSDGVLARPRASAVTVEGQRLHVKLEDGREVSVPVAWFDWLARATQDQRQSFKIVGAGRGIWWDDLDDGISVPLLMGLPADS